jgi:hypothetical protein
MQSNELVRAMKYRVFGAMIASVSAATLLLASNATFARSGIAPHGMLAASPHAGAHPLLRPPHRFRGRNPFVYWPGGGGFYYEPSSGEPYANPAQPQSSDVSYTNIYDVPWDWAHRLPPNVAPSDRPFVPSCPSETVTVPGRSGETTVNIMRCY